MTRTSFVTFTCNFRECPSRITFTDLGAQQQGLPDGWIEISGNHYCSRHDITITKREGPFVRAFDGPHWREDHEPACPNCGDSGRVSTEQYCRECHTVVGGNDPDSRGRDA